MVKKLPPQSKAQLFNLTRRRVPDDLNLRGRPSFSPVLALSTLSCSLEAETIDILQAMTNLEHFYDEMELFVKGVVEDDNVNELGSLESGEVNADKNQQQNDP